MSEKRHSSGHKAAASESDTHEECILAVAESTRALENTFAFAQKEKDASKRGNNIGP